MIDDATQKHMLDYALALNEQINVLVHSYEQALVRWRFERAALLAKCAVENRRDCYIADLERDLYEAWDQIESLQRNAVFELQREMQMRAASAGERERRLAIEIERARHAELVALRQVQQVKQELDAQKRMLNAAEKRADSAVAERDLLAQRCHDASEQAVRIAATVAELEEQMSSAIAERDAEIRQLIARCDGYTGKKK